MLLAVGRVGTHRLAWVAARAPNPRIGNLRKADIVRGDEVAPHGRGVPKPNTPRQPVEGGSSPRLEEKDGLLIGQEYLVPLQPGGLRVERRSAFEQFADSLTRPRLQRHDYDDSAWLPAFSHETLPAAQRRVRRVDAFAFEYSHT